MGKLLFDTTICAPATHGGAISVIRVSGPDAIATADSITRSKSLLSAEGYTMHYDAIMDDCQVLDDVIISVFRAPHSYTGEDSVEISCHASPYIVSRILDLLVSNGACLAGPGEFTQRAFVNGKMDLSQAEAVADVIAANSRLSHQVASAQLRGGYSRDLEKIRSQLLEIASLLELELDFSEEEVEFAERGKLLELARAAALHCHRKAESFRVGNAAKNGVPVAIVGAPNSGKSTLLNALLGDDRAIVSDIPGTTRDTIEDSCVIGGILFRFIDTAGIREHTDDKIEQIGIERSLKEIERARIVLHVMDASSTTRAEETASLLPHLHPNDQLYVPVINKIDMAATELTSAEASAAPSTLPASEASSTSPSAPSPASEAPLTSPSVPSPASAVSSTLLSSLPSSASTVPSLSSSPSPLPLPSPDRALEALQMEAIGISALTGDGLDELRTAIVNAVQKDIDSFLDSGHLVSSQRHATELAAAATDLDAVCHGIETGLPGDLIAEDLRSAINHLGAITGTITTPDILKEIFSKHCIGK